MNRVTAASVPMLRRLVAILAMLGWSAAAFGSALADAGVESRAMAFGAHVEAPGQGPAHAAHDHQQCAWCHLLHIVGCPGEAGAAPVTALRKVEGLFDPAAPIVLQRARQTVARAPPLV